MKDSVMACEKVLLIELKNDPEYQPLLNGKPQTCGMRAGRVHLEPGETCGEHSTDTYEETLVFLSGRGTSFITEKQKQIASEVCRGNVCYIPPHTLHNIKNTGTEPLVYIYCVAPVHKLENELNKPIHEHHHEEH